MPRIFFGRGTLRSHREPSGVCIICFLHVTIQYYTYNHTKHTYIHYVYIKKNVCVYMHIECVCLLCFLLLSLLSSSCSVCSSATCHSILAFLNETQMGWDNARLRCRSVCQCEHVGGTQLPRKMLIWWSSGLGVRFFKNLCAIKAI